MASRSLDAWLNLKPSTTPKRKHDVGVDASDKENTPAETSTSRKKVKTTLASKAVKSKPKASASASAGTKEAKKLYTETLKAVDKRVADLDKKVKVMGGNSRSITTASYATSAGKHIKTAKKLADLDTILGFKLLLSLADASHTDLDASCKMCGTPCDSSIPTFTALDEALLPLIEKRERTAPSGTDLPSVPARWTREEADVGPYKTSNGPNKQQRGQIYRQKLDWEKRRTAARRTRRETTEDWVAVALADLKEERDYLAAYGVEEYLPKSIAKLEEFVAGNAVTLSA